MVPFIEGSRTYVPVRFISEGLGATVSWNAATQSIDITSQNIHIKLVIGQKNMIVSNKQVQMDAPAIIRGGRTFVPVRFIAEALDKNVYFENGLIVISSKDITLDATTDKSLLGMLRGRIDSPDGMKLNGDFQRPDLMGVISSISGNNVSLKLIAMPQFNGTYPGNGASGGRLRDSNPNTQDQRQAGEQRTQNFTGEVKNISIPAGTSITTTIRGDQGRQTKNLLVSDLKVDDTLSVTYSDKVSETISKISVRQRLN